MAIMFMDFEFKTDIPQGPVQSTNVTAENVYVTDEDKERYLNSLQEETNIRNIPTFIFLIALSIVGLFGNVLILVVYSHKKRKTATIVFIKSIAVVDLITNVIVIPVTIYVLFRTWDFHDRLLCKGFLFFNLATASTSAILLLGVAIVRYRKVCVPLGWQVTTRQAKIISITIALISCLTSIPYTVVHGLQDIETGRDGIRGRECRVDQEYVNTIWPQVVSAISLIIFLACCIPLTVMYILVGVTAWRHSQAFGATLVNEVKTLEQNTPGNSSNSKTCSSDTLTKTECYDLEERDKPRETSNKNSDTLESKQGKGGSSTERKGLDAIGRKVANRTTRMLLTISVVYIITNLTTLVLVFVRSTAKEQVLNQGAASDTLYRLFLQIFMVNCAVNPFIYGMCDRNFRKESLAYVKRLACQQKCPLGQK
ncbi:hypothetical protein Btru_042717 [Bulinus truncatus]|nr:hypothetical protein Btru_042717 [Bulinus truncatus]